MKVDGHCHCEAVAYEAEVDPETVGICHCTDCQRLTGAPFRATIPAPAAGFRLIRGETRHYVKTAESGNKRAHHFCGNCGSPMWAQALENTPSYSLRVGSIVQNKELGGPKRQIWCDSALSWSMDLSEVPKLPRG